MLGRLVRFIPSWAAGVLWFVGMVISAGVVLTLLYVSVAAFFEAVQDERVGMAIIELGLVAAIVALTAFTARWWWRELRRYQEVLPKD